MHIEEEEIEMMSSPLLAYWLTQVQKVKDGQRNSYYYWNGVHDPVIP